MNCVAMEQTDCECPCECPLQSDICHDDVSVHLLPVCEAEEEEIAAIKQVPEDVQNDIPICFDTQCEGRTEER